MNEELKGDINKYQNEDWKLWMEWWKQYKIRKYNLIKRISAESQNEITQRRTSSLDQIKLKRECQASEDKGKEFDHRVKENLKSIEKKIIHEQNMKEQKTI